MSIGQPCPQASQLSLRYSLSKFPPKLVPLHSSPSSQLTAAAQGPLRKMTLVKGKSALPLPRHGWHLVRNGYDFLLTLEAIRATMET